MASAIRAHHEPETVVVRHTVTRAGGPPAAHCSIRDVATGDLCAEFASTRWAAVWLEARGFRYVTGSSGLWSRVQ